MFLMRMRRRVPFEGLRLFFGIAVGTAHNYFDEMRVLFSKHVMLRLLHPRSGAEIDTWSSDNVKRDLPGAKIIFYLTAFPWSSKENVSEHSMILRDGLPPGEKFGVADSAYIRALDELKSMLYLPAKLPENGDNLQVLIFFCFWPNVRLVRSRTRT